MGRSGNGTRPPLSTQEAWVVIDLGFGDAGKGGVTDFLVRDRAAGLVVRFNGGAQAGHNVVTDDGRHHTFSQFCSGSFVPGVRGLLGPEFILHPLGMMVEEEHLRTQGVEDGWSRTLIDERARVITPYQQAMNRIRELLRGDLHHGSCGVGIGECVGDSIEFPEDTIRAEDLRKPVILREKLEAQRSRKIQELHAQFSDGKSPHGANRLALQEETRIFEDSSLQNRVLSAWAAFSSRAYIVGQETTAATIADEPRIVFEGAQGVLLDQDWGFHPHTTWSDCSPRGALQLAGKRKVEVLGVTRSYSVRHGAGPFPTEGLAPSLAEAHNTDEGWQGSFRTGPLDGVLLRYACDTAAPIDGIVITHLDHLHEDGSTVICSAYERDGEIPLERLSPGARADLNHRNKIGLMLRQVTPRLQRVDSITMEVSRITGRPVILESFGPSATEKLWRTTDHTK
jgi:adenylosuccinate synthase